MIPYYPQKLATPAIAIYLLCIATVSFVFSRYAMEFAYIFIGAIGVIGFFVLLPSLTKQWQNLSVKSFESKLFWISLIIRVVWMLGLYIFYTQKTGEAYEIGAADEIAYFNGGYELSKDSIVGLIHYINGGIILGGLSDTGYLVLVALVNKITGKSIILFRLLKCIIGSLTCVLVYRIASRGFGENTGKIAGIMYALLPNTFFYCANHLKENFMVFILVAFVERTDYLFKSKNFSFVNIIVPTILALLLLTFRTVLAFSAFFSFATAAFFTSYKQMKGRGRKFLILAWIVVVTSFLWGGKLVGELQESRDQREVNEQLKTEQRIKRGAKWAKYATGTVMAPMIFVLPFSTMVDIDEQYRQQLRNGGNFIHNFLGYFVIVALVVLFITKRTWKQHILLLSLTICYLGIVTIGGYANAERFIFPAFPFLTILSAYGVTELTPRAFKFFTPWLVLLFFMEFGWAFFKLGARNIVSI